MNKKLVIFDFDGTVVDSMEAFSDVAGSVISRVYGLPFNKARRLYIETSGLPFVEQIEHICPGDPRNSDATSLFEREKLEGYFEQKIYPDIKPTLSFLKERNIFRAISSNNYQNLVEKFVSNAKLDFNYVLGFKDKYFCKGTPHFDFLIKRSGLPKEDMLFVGDSLKDAERALDYGIDFIGKTGLFSKEEFSNKFKNIRVIVNISELTKILLESA